MKRLKTKELQPGMILAEDVVTFNGQLILPKNLVLTDSTITRLEFHSILSVRIKDTAESNSTLFQNLILTEVDNDAEYELSMAKQAEYEQFKSIFENSMYSFKDYINTIVERNIPIDTNSLSKEIGSIYELKASNLNIFTMLHSMHSYDDSTYSHSLNVALISMVFANWLNFSEEEIETALLCGLLHDIGKLMIPDEIIKKPSKLTREEFDIIKTHPMKGYDILKNSNLDIHIKNAALMHHEKCDGSGYPLQLKSSSIDPFAKMVAIADIYDATTSARIYRGPLCPFHAIELFQAEGYQKYDPHFILTFLENVVNSYIGSTAELSDKRIVEIILINKLDLAKPVVKCNNEFIDLSKLKGIYIKRILQSH